MRKTKIKKPEEMKPEEIKPEETKPEEINETSLEDDFKMFEETVSKFKPENKKEPEKIIDGENIIADNFIQPDAVTEFKIKMFLGFALFLLTGFNTFIFNKFLRKDISISEMELNEREKDAVSKYLNSPEIIRWLQKIPSYIWAILHIEFMYYQKYQFAVKLKEKNKKEEKIKNKK